MLKRILDSLDGVDESLHGLYKKGDDGKLHLQVEAEDTSELKNALEQERENVTSMKTERNAAQTQVTSLTGQLERAKKGGGKADPEAVKAEVEAQTAELVLKHTDELKTKDDRISGLTTNIHNTLKDSAALSAISGAKGISQLLMPVVRGRLDVQEVEGKFEVHVLTADGKPALSRKPGSGTAPMLTDELVEGFREDEHYGRAFEGYKASGTGSSTDGGKPNTDTTVKSRADLKTPADKAAFISEHGGNTYLELPATAE